MTWDPGIAVGAGLTVAGGTTAGVAGSRVHRQVMGIVNGLESREALAATRTFFEQPSPRPISLKWLSWGQGAIDAGRGMVQAADTDVARITPKVRPMVRTAAIAAAGALAATAGATLLIEGTIDTLRSRSSG